MEQDDYYQQQLLVGQLFEDNKQKVSDHKEFGTDVLYRPLTRGIVRKICAQDTVKVSKQVSCQQKIRRKRKRIVSKADQSLPKKLASSSLKSGMEPAKNPSSSFTGKRQKKLRTWIPIETLPLLLNSVLESIDPEERAIYDRNKIQDFLLKIVSEFSLGISSFGSSQLFEMCQQYLLSHIVGNPAFHSSFRVDFRSPVSIKSHKHLLVNTSNLKESTSWNIERYPCESEETTNVDASEQDVLNIHLGPRRLTRTLYQVLRSSSNNEEAQESGNLYNNELSSVAKQKSEMNERNAKRHLSFEESSPCSSSEEMKEFHYLSHPIVRFLPILHNFFQSTSQESQYCVDKLLASVQMKACLLQVLNKLPDKDIAVIHESWMKSSDKRLETNSDLQGNWKTQKSNNETIKSSLTCPYELARKDRILRNEEILRRITSDKLTQRNLSWNERQEDDGLSGCSSKEPCELLIKEEMERLRKVLQDFGIYCDFPLWRLLDTFVQLLVKELDENTSHSPSFYSTCRDIRRMERVLESCSENEQVNEAVKRYLRVLQSTEYRERRNLFTLFRGPWNDENKNAIFFKAWEKYGNGRDANKLIATEMGSEVHPNQVAYMKSLYPGWLVYKQMLSVTSLQTNGQQGAHPTEYQPICALCLAPNNCEDNLGNPLSLSREDDLDLGPIIGPLRFAAFNSAISSSCSSSFSSNSGYFVHRLCALWAPEVFEAYDGTLLNIAQAIQRARQIFCCYCRRKGASLGCKECKRCYHAPKCALLAGCYLDTTTFQLLCPLHARVEAAVMKNGTQLQI